MQPVGARDVAHHGERLFEMRCRTRRAGSAEQERDVELVRGAQKPVQVGTGRGRSRRQLAAAEVIGPGVDRPISAPM